MTDTTFYNDMASLATELMNDFGTPATHRKVTQPKPDASGKSVPQYEDTPGLAVQIHDNELIQMMNLEGDVAYAAKFAVAEISPEHQIIHQGNTMTIVSVKVVNPEGNRMMIAFLGTKRAT